MVLTLFGIFLATRSFVLESIARPHIVATVGGDIDIGRVRWVGWAQLEITDLSVRAPGWKGASGEVIRVDRARIKLDSAALRRGSFEVDRVEVDGLLVRLAEDAAEPASFNILALRPELGGGGSPPARIDVLDLELQMGIDRNGEWERKGSVQLAGDLIAADDRPRVFVFQFVTHPDNDRPRSVLKGELDTSSLAFNASIDDLQVDNNLLGMMPMELRRAAQSMNLKGHVQRVETAWDGKRDLYAAIDLAEAELTVPDPGEESAWSRLDTGVITTSSSPPVMQVTSGQIALIDDRITLEGFEGRFTSARPNSDEIPVRLDFQMDLAPVLKQQLDWSRSREFAAQVFRIAPFSLKLTVPNFEIRADSEGVILPTAAARTLAQFGIEEWQLDISAHLRRGLPEDSADGTLLPAPVHTSGTVLVDNGVGRYSRFPYPLENVSAYIEFDDKSVRINYLTGEGPNGGVVSVDGIIIDPGPAAEIAVHLLGRAVPADDVFRTSLEGWRLRTWDRFFDKSAEQRMRQAGLLPGIDDVEDARRERTELLNRLSGPEEIPEEQRARIQAKADRLQRVIEAGPFELGGLFDFDLTVSSAAGVGKPVDLTGTIEIIEGDVLLADFPLPTHLLESSIELQADNILLGEGITFTTPWGGSGLIRGNIQSESENDVNRMKPDITFAAIDVSISPALLAALPPSNEDQPPEPDLWPGAWHSEAAMALEALGIHGLVDLEGRWFAEAMGEDAQLNFDAELREGEVQPNLELTEFFAKAGFEWPEGFTLADCAANIHLDPTIVRMTDFSGHRLGGEVTADGFISREGDEQALHVAFRSIQLEEYLLNLVPEGPQERARILWSRFKPRGTFDADLDWSTDTRNERRSLVVAWPHEVVLYMDGTDVTVERQRGEIRIKADEIQLNDLLLSLSSPELSHGKVFLDGSYGRTPPENELMLSGEVEDGHFESPVLTVLLDLFGAHRVRDTWIELEPSGRFDSLFEYRVLADGEPEYMVDLVPTSLSATIDEDRIHAAFDDGSIFITPSRIDLERLMARIPAPGTIEIDGTVGIGSQIDLLLAARYDLDALNTNSHAYFPVPLSNGFESVDFETDGRLQLTDATIAGIWDRDASINEPELYEFDGQVEFEDAKFTAGTTFDRFDGSTHITLTAKPDASDVLRVQLLAPIQGESLDAQLRRVDSPRATIRIDGTDILTINDLQGDMAGGRIVGEVTVDMARRSWEFELDLEDASLQELSRGRDDPLTDGTIGRVLANIKLFGLSDDPASKRGRGRIIVEDGEMTNSPLTLSIVQLSQLMLPMSDSLEFAEIAFTVEGDRMVFDEFLLTSPTIEFIGSGEMSMVDWELALRLAPRGTVPILSDLIGTFTGTLYAINIGGTLGSPNATIEPLPVLGSPATIEDPAPPEQEERQQAPAQSPARNSG